MMNERIRELREQSGLQPYYEAQERQIEKFAELVLQDVMNLFGDERISLHYLEQPCCEDSVYLLQLKIKEHFGVK
jgi:hypothetical protein